MVAQVQNAGLANITAAINAYASVPKYLQWGTGTGKDAANTAVTGTNTTEARTSGTTSQQTTTVTSDTFRVTGTITAANTRTISELGVYDAAGSGSPPTGGNMCFYGDFANVGLSTSDSITFTVNVKFS
jgi:Flp pilus assembly protein TadG